MLGNKLKELRKEKGLTQQDISREFNLGMSTVASYELSRREPDLKTLIRFADFYNVSLDELVGRPKIIEDLSRQEIESI